MSAHSIIAPSSAARRYQCPRSTTLELMFPEEEQSQDALDGEASHWAGQEQLSGRLVDVGQIAANGVVLTQEMVEGADLYYDDVVKTLKPFGLAPHQGHIEERMAIPRVHAQSFGTPDYWIAVPGVPLRLFIWDYKFGYRIVEAFENRQMVEYLAGATEGIPDTTPVELVVTVVQPRAPHRDGPIRRWRTTLLNLRALINQQSNAAHEALGGDPRAVVGPECRDCRGRHACEALQRAGLAAMDQAYRTPPLAMTPAGAGLELRMVDQAIERLKARRTGLEQQLLGELKRGATVPGWALQPGQSREKWKVPAAQVIATGQLMHLNLAKPPEAITPTQARKAGLDPAIVSSLAERPPAGVELVADDGSLARRVFGHG